MYKVFVKYQTIIFAQDSERLSVPPFDMVQIDPENITHFYHVMHHHLNGDNRNTLVIADTADNIYQRAFTTSYYPVTAAGGVVVNRRNNNILTINRHGVWDLPKGKQDPGENLATCAIREILEETGIQAHLSSPVPFITKHIYQEKNRRILKSTYWFLMSADGNMPKESTPEEGITEIHWGDRSFIDLQFLPGTFPLIREVFDHFQMLWPEYFSEI